MKMQCGCELSYSQIDFDGNERFYCSIHDTYMIKHKENPKYNDFPILSDEEYEAINQKYEAEN